MTTAHAGLARWHEYMERGADPALLNALIADDAVFHSPVVHTPQAGKALVMGICSPQLKCWGMTASTTSGNWSTGTR